MSERRHIDMKGLTLFLVGVVILLSYLNKALFTHSHLLPDGTIVVHAHPYLKHRDVPGKEGGHSAAHHHPLDLLHLPDHHVLFYQPVEMLRIEKPFVPPHVLSLPVLEVFVAPCFPSLFIRPPPAA